MLTWEKRVEVQRAHAALINSIHELKKNFDALLKKDKEKQGETKSATPVNMPARGRCKYCGQVHKLRQCLACWNKCEKCNKMNHFIEVNRSSKCSAVHNIEIEDEQEQETDIEMLNMNSIRFHSNNSTIIANLKTLSNKVPITVPCKVDTGSNVNIMPFHICKNYTLGQQWNS